MQVAPKPRKKPAAPEAGLNPAQVAPIRNPPRQAPEAEPKLPPRVAEAGRNSAVGAITRLINMGLPEYLVSSALTLVVAQRLIRV
jgi:hypothetical protein